MPLSSEPFLPPDCSAVRFNSSIGDWFRTRVGVRQGCLLSPILFNIFLERIMEDALEDHEGTVSIGGRTITNHALLMTSTAQQERKKNGKISRVSQQSLHSIRHGDQCRGSQADDKQHQWHQYGNQSKMDRSLRQSQASPTWAKL